jgi:hypothetical protein
MERVFEELPLGAVALPDLLDLHEGDRPAGGMAQGVSTRRPDREYSGQTTRVS